MIGRLTLAAALLTLAAGALAQQPPSLRVSGTVESFDGRMLAVKSAKLAM